MPFSDDDFDDDLSAGGVDFDNSEGGSYRDDFEVEAVSIFLFVWGS